MHEMGRLVKETAKDAPNLSPTSEEALAVVEQITVIISEINKVVSTIETEMSRYPYK